MVVASLTAALSGLVWHSTRMPAVDGWVLAELGAHTHGQSRLAAAVTIGFTALTLVVMVTTAGFAWLAVRRWDAVLLALTAPAAALAAEKLLKMLVLRRAPGSAAPHFPSGHLAVAAAVALSLVLVLRSAGVRRGVTAITVLCASLVMIVLAWARLAETAHLLSDLVGGVGTGVTVTLFVALCYDRRALSRLHGRPGTSPPAAHVMDWGNSDPRSLPPV